MSSTERQHDLAVIAAIVLLALLVFGRAVTFDFVNLDDNSNLQKNPAMQQFSLVWSKPYLDAYLPVVYTVWYGMHWFAGTKRPAGDTLDTFTPIPELDPLPFHALNVLLHALNGVLLFLFMRRVFVAAPVAILALLASLFVVHPLQVEPVAWVTALKDVLSATFALLLLLMYVQKPLVDYRGRQDVVRMALLAGIFLLACLSKSTRIFLPLYLLPLGVLHWRQPWLRVAGSLWPLFALMLLVMALAMVVQPVPKDTAFQELWRRPLVAADSMAFYLRKLVWPAQLALDYGRNPRFLFESGQVWWWGWLAPLMGTGWWWARRRIDSWCQLGLAGFVLGLLPLLGLQPFVFQTISTVSDRYAYLSIALLCAGLVPLLAQLRWQKPAVAVLALLVLACSLRSFAQLPVWRSSATLWQHTLQVTPDSGIAHNNLASIHEVQGRTADAIAHYEQSFVRLPRADVCSRIAILHTDLRQWQQAMLWIEKGLQLAPDDPMLLHNRTVVEAQLKPRSFRLKP